jgi:hypothetical protein
MSYLGIASIVGVAALVCLGCGGTPSSAFDGSIDLAPDHAGTTSGSPDAGTSSDVVRGLKVNASILAVRDRLLGDEESFVNGYLMVERDGALVADAVVVLNGVAVPLMIDYNGAPSEGLYDPKHVRVPQTAAGQALKLTVTQGGETVALDMPCPAEVIITSPGENAQVSSGTPLTVTWSGTLDTGIFPADSQMPLTTTYDILLPYLLFYEYDPVTPEIGLSQGKQLLLRDLRASSATITVPTRPNLVLQLFVHGKGATSPDGRVVGTCSLIRRVLLQTKAE